MLASASVQLSPIAPPEATDLVLLAASKPEDLFLSERHNKGTGEDNNFSKLISGREEIDDGKGKLSDDGDEENSESNIHGMHFISVRCMFSSN